MDLGPDKGVWQRVIAGSFTQKDQAKTLLHRIKFKSLYCKPMNVETSNQFSVHLASYGTFDTAAKELEKLAKEAGDLLGDQLSIRRVDLGKKGIWYRLLGGRFDDREGAASLEEALKAKGLYARTMDFSFQKE